MTNNCNNCDQPLINNNTICTECNTLSCCTEIYKTECIKHNGETLKDIITTLVENDVDITYDVQSIGGINGSSEEVTINLLINNQMNQMIKTYDLSGITVGGNPGPVAASADAAIQFLINKINEEH